MAVVVEGGATVGNATSGPPAAIAKPTGTVASDLLLILINQRNAAAGGFTAPAGFTEITDAAPGISGAVGAFWRICDGSEGASFTVASTTTGGYAQACVRLTGTDQTTPVQATSLVLDSTTPWTAPSVAGTADGVWIVQFATQTGTTEPVEPAGWSQAFSTILPGGTRSGLACDYKALAATGATGTQDFTVSAGSGNIGLNSITIAPAAAAAAPTLPVMMAPYRTTG